MTRYVATGRYRSAYCQAFSTGPLAKGDVVDISEEAAAAFNRDSAGILVLESPPLPAPVAAPVAAVAAPAEPEAEARDVEAPEADRRVKRAYNRRSQ